MESGGDIIGLAEEKPVKAEAKSRARKKAGRRKGPVFKLTRFDRDLAALVKNGVTDVPTILQKTALDPENFNARLNVLVKKGFFVFDAATRSTLRLGWKGYNLFAPKLKTKISLPKPAEPPEQPPIQPALEERREEKRVFSPPADTSVQILPAPQTTSDLAELLEKGSPKTAPPKTSLFVERQQKKEPEKRTQEENEKPTDTGKALILEGVEACELCKAKFKLNVKNTERAKFGHCFCGAAFHKDCYESLSEGGGNCVRCGRKLKLMFDKKAEDAVKGIKDAFE
ncbi:MAG: hypothetical protein QXR53_04105 [Candidatus Norongarragalinales archaeon]